MISPATPWPSSLNPDDIELFIRTTNNELKSYSWNSSAGWYGLNIRVSSGVVSSPSAVIRDANDVDIFYQLSGANLGKLSWNLSGPWTTYSWSADMASGTSPAVISRTSGNLDVFYCKNIGYLKDRYWDWTIGWNLQEWAGQLTGNPAAIALGPNDMDVVYRESGTPDGNIKNLRWNSQTGTTTQFLTNNDAAGDPAIIQRSADTMDVFYRTTGGKLKVTTWSATTNTWTTPTEPQ